MQLDILVLVLDGVPKEVNEADKRRIADLEKSDILLRQELSKLKVQP